MSEIFLKIINMSISASYILLAVLLLRLLLRRAPKWITVLLWGMVAIRLVCPFSLESILSLIPSAEVVSPDIMMDQTPTINTGIPIINSTLNPVINESFTPNPGDSVNPLQIWIPALTAGWCIGVVALLAYTVFSYAKIKRRIGTAVLCRDNIYQSENVASPFVLGIIKPKIYLPFSINERDMVHVIAHEMAHIRRKDHLWKPIGFLLLALHWFNPLMWVGYVLLCRDIELACDEKVIKALDHDARADYSDALLACSVNRPMITACPLAFGEVGVKDRVKAILNYKKPAFWIILAALVACVVVAVCFLTNPPTRTYGETNPKRLNDTQIALMEQFPEYFGIEATDGLDIYVWKTADDQYFFGLLPHSEIMRPKASSELRQLKAANINEIREILATYKIENKDFYVIPCRNPSRNYEELTIASRQEPEFESQIKELIFGDEDQAVVEEALHVIFSKATYINILYDTPVTSYVMDCTLVPEILYGKSGLYDAGTGEKIGNLKKIELDQTDFVQDVCQYGEQYGNGAKAIQNGTRTAYEVRLSSPGNGIDLYYVLIQEDGTVLLIYGHYQDGEKAYFIRFIYAIGTQEQLRNWEF